MKKYGVLLITIFTLTCGAAWAVQGTSNPNASGDPNQYIDPDTGAVCVTRPGKLKPLILNPVKSSSYYKFLKQKNMTWVQKIRAFFRNVYPLTEQES
jgi:hypothetical protein